MTRLYLANDTSAIAAGAERLVEAWHDHPEIQIVRTSSRGAFFLEPMVERDSPDGRVAWVNVRPGDVDRILAGEGATAVSDIPFLAQQQRHTFANFGLTRPLSLSDYQTAKGFTGLARARMLGSEAIIEEIRLSRLRGRGGAAFPVWQKWEVARSTDSTVKYVVANADEGDAGTYCDRMIMEGDPFRLIEGMLICATAIGAEAGYVYCRQEYPAAAQGISTAIAMARDAALLVVNGQPFSLEVFRGAGSYVCGEETALLASLEGRRGEVQAKPPYPAVSGLYGRPTVVSNVLTFATVPTILSRGGAWHASLGTDGSRGTVVLQLGGRVRQPGLVEIPFGVTIREVLDRFGGGMVSGATFKAVQVGGPLGSLFPESGLDLPLCYDEFAERGAILGHGGIVVYDSETDMVELARHFMAFTADESCGKCTPCRIGSVRGRELLEHIKSGRGTRADLELLRDLGDTMKMASLCALGGRAPYPVLTAMEHFGSEFTARVRA